MMSANGAACRRARCSSVWSTRIEWVRLKQPVRPSYTDLAGELDIPAGDAHKRRRRPRHSTPCRVVIVSPVAAGLHGQDAGRRLPDHERIVDPPVPLQPFRLAAAPLEALKA